MIDTPPIEMLGTVAGIGLLVTIVTEIVLRAWNPTAAVKDRFAPFLALILGVIFGVLGAVTGDGQIVGGILLGILSAGTGMGIHDTVDAAVSS